MPNFIWTLIYLFVALWAITRLIAWLLQWCLKHYLDVQVKVVQIGLFRFRNVQAVIKRGLNVEIGQIWLSSCFVNPEIRKPLVLCIQEVRIQADIENVDSGREHDPPRQHQSSETGNKERETIPKWLHYVQFLGIRVENLTVMLLKTMLPYSLIHIEGQDISIDSTITNESLNLALNLTGVTCKALQSLEDIQESTSQQCLAELSVSVFTELEVNKVDPKKFQVLRFLVSKPQMMITEGFLQSLQLISIGPRQPNSPIENTDAESKLIDFPRLKNLKEVSFDCSELNIKILREKKQRSLGVGLTLFHLSFHNESKHFIDLSCNIVLDDFQTSSSQARFAGVTKVEHKMQVVRDNITNISAIRGGFFHYHHDEIQYWTTVLHNILDNKRPNNAYRRLSTSTPPPSRCNRSGVVAWISEKKIEYSIELSDLSSTLSSASCTGFHAGVSLFKISGNIKPTYGIDVNNGYLASHDVIFEAEVNCVYCWHIEAGMPVNLLGKKKHHWDHIFYLEMVMIKVKKMNKQLKIEGMKDNLQIEWSTNTLNTLLQLMSSLLKSKQQLPLNIPPTDESSNHSVLPPKPKNSSTSLSCISLDLLTVNIDITNINIFVLNDHKVSLMLRTDSISMEHQQYKSSMGFNGLKLVYLHQQEPFQSLSRSVDLQKPVASIKEIRLVYKHDEKEVTIQLKKELLVVWTTHAHMCFHQGLQDVEILIQKLKGYMENSKELDEVKLSNIKPTPVKLQLNVLLHANITFTAQLSNQHEVTLHTNSILLTGKLPSCLLEINDLIITFDQQDIFRLKSVVFETLSPKILQRERQAAGNLQLLSNRTWGISIESFGVVFPYNYNFSTCFEEVVNIVKWLKLVHKVQKKPFTAESKLPPDLHILVKLFSVQLSDDPFEVKLGDNYELLKDEYFESINRKVVLDAKIGELQRQHGRIPASRVEDLYSSLARKSADIYIQRSKQYHNTASPRTKLFTWTMEEVEISALADLSFHGKDNVVRHMQDIDSDSPYPIEGLEFSTLWCRCVNFSVKTWLVRLRDYPLPMLKVQDMHVWGRLIGAEQAALKRARRTCVVDIDKPWGDMKVERSLPPLKFFHDFSCDMKSLTIAYGVCWEAAFAQYNICLDMVNKPSIDPSQPLPFWDKIRLLFHGRWTMSIGKMNWLYHAQFDPFNQNELMEWMWSNVVLDWTNGKFLLKGDLDISAKTESKYDDCKMFHLPNLRFCVRLEWLCPGNSNDHHSVMPCAPDKVPDYSMEVHDSFRAFRSEKLNLDISLETQRIKENPEDIPSCYFYASTLRFMDKIKSCLLSTTRPVRRGKYFQTTSKRKLQLSRHYKKIKMSVNFHQFLIRYWMSFAKQHGFEVLSDSFTLNMCDKLALRPIEDGLIHRPASEWSVYYLICNLGNTKTWLCQAMPHDGEENLLNMSIRGPVDKSFFLSVASVTYKRGERSKKNESKEGEADHITPTHSVQVIEMRGLWTKKNRLVLIGIYDSYQKAQSLRRNLSSKALKGFKVEGKDHGNKATSMSSLVSGPPSSPVVATSPLSKLQTSHALSMLIKLVSESDSKSVAFTEEPSSSNMEQLHGVRACQTDDVVQKNWLIELDNSQIILKGCETLGYVIVSAAKAQILSCLHHPIWRNGQLRSKTTWVGSVECMQYYATVDEGDEFEDDDIPWLSKENVEVRFDPDLSGVPEMVGSGHSVGGVISNIVGPSNKKSGGTVQLQRIISRCKCQFFYANYGDIKPNELPEVPLPPAEESDVLEMEEGIDVFTILHHDLNMCSNPLQYTIILDIVNNLLLYVEPKEREAKENLQSMRFRLQLSRVEDQKTPILQLQEKVRSKALELRRYEKELHKLQKEIPEESTSDFQLLDVSCDLQQQLNGCKSDVYKLNEELSIRISCYKESQLQVKQQMKMDKAQQADVVRRNEVCFKFAQWRLTEKDGQLGITDITLRNFVYSKVNRDDDSWTHQLELGWVKMTNLLPNSIYKDVLLPRDPMEKENRQMTLRILCSERPPVGGIAIKEHFEVNVVPMQLQLTYHFYRAVMAFFFPDKNIETDGQDDDIDGQKKKFDKKSNQREKEKKESSVKKNSSFTSTDKIDIMKMRAASNNSFLYIKIPELLVRVSYKGEKEKNIEDVHDFSFVLPTMEHHNRIWTWFDVFMATKNHSKRILLSQAIKHKLHMKSRADEPLLTDVQQEEDKAKMLLGAKLLAGQDKPAKKSLFSKSSKS